MTDTRAFAAGRRTVADFGTQLLEQDLATPTDGSVAVSDGERVAVTPAGGTHGETTSDDVALLDLEGDPLDDEAAPSDEWRLHVELLRSRDDVGAVVHVRAPYVSTFAALADPIPASHYLIAFAGDEVPVAEYATPGSAALAEGAAATLGDEYDACLLRNDGLVAVGPNADAALEVAVMMEYCARIHYQALDVGDPAVLSDADVAELREIFVTYAGGKTDHDDTPVAPPAGDELAAERERVAELGLRMLNEGLTKGTGGNVSVRNGDRAAINPSGVPYTDIDPADVPLVSLDGEQVTGAQGASSETPMHTAIYRRRPEVCCVIHTHSPYASTFASLDEPVPASHHRMAAIGDRIPVAGFEQPGTEALGRLAVEALGDDYGACLLKNHGVIAVGETPERAYETAATVEYCARVHYQALGAGTPTTVPEDELDGLKRRYADADR